MLVSGVWFNDRYCDVMLLSRYCGERTLWLVGPCDVAQLREVPGTCVRRAKGTSTASGLGGVDWARES